MSKQQETFNLLELRPTRLISPNGFQIIDALFRTKAEKLKTYPSALSFCMKFGLDQPKISRMMKALQVNTLFDLRVKVSKLKSTWWDMAFWYPTARRKMMPFGKIFESYEILKGFNMEEMLKAPSTIEGPLSVAQKLGYLKSAIPTLWVEQEGLPELKKRFRLVPATNSVEGLQKTSIWLGTSKNGFAKEAITIGNRDFRDINKLSKFGNINIFRLLYDLSFFDARSKEVRDEILKDVLNAD